MVGLDGAVLMEEHMEYTHASAQAAHDADRDEDREGAFLGDTTARDAVNAQRLAERTHSRAQRVGLHDAFLRSPHPRRHRRSGSEARSAPRSAPFQMSGPGLD